MCYVNRTTTLAIDSRIKGGIARNAIQHKIKAMWDYAVAGALASGCQINSLRRIKTMILIRT